MFKILVIDDLDLLFLGSSLLRQRGFDVFSLSRGENVFYCVNFFKPDLILLDVKLGDRDGRDICRQLKDNPNTQGVKVILYSAFPETMVEYVRCGADDFVTKPYEMDQLIEKIRQLLPA